jgi:hypothetical protein
MLVDGNFPRSGATMSKPIATLLLCLASTFPAAASWSETPEEAAIASARAVMDAFLQAFNARDESAWADTLFFPHVRVAGGGVVVIENKDAFVASMDMDEFARTFNWGHSEWDAIEVIQAGPEKVHFKVRFSRFDPAGVRNATFDSLYIVQKVDDRWGVRARSSFAP